MKPRYVTRAHDVKCPACGHPARWHRNSRGCQAGRVHRDADGEAVLVEYCGCSQKRWSGPALFAGRRRAREVAVDA